MKTLKTATAIIILTILLSPLQSVFAEDGQENTVFNRHVGPYVEGCIGKTLIWFPDFFGNDFASGGFYGYGFSVGGGYMFKHWLGAEAGYFLIKPRYAGEDSDENLYGFYLTSRFNIPIKDRFSIFFKLGVTTLSATSVEDDTVTPYAGLGAGYALTDKIDLRVQFQGPNLLIWGASSLGGGIAYHF